MGYYNSDNLDDVITCLKDAIIETSNLSLALCWLVELFVAIHAKKSGRIGKFYFLTTDARRLCKLSKQYRNAVSVLITYRNTYVHEGKYRANNTNIKTVLPVLQQFALNQCNVYLDINRKQFDV